MAFLKGSLWDIVRKSNLTGRKCLTFNDHRIAMSLAVAGAISQKGD